MIKLLKDNTMDIKKINFEYLATRSQIVILILTQHIFFLSLKQTSNKIVLKMLLCSSPQQIMAMLTNYFNYIKLLLRTLNFWTYRVLLVLTNYLIQWLGVRGEPLLDMVLNFYITCAQI